MLPDEKHVSPLNRAEKLAQTFLKKQESLYGSSALAFLSLFGLSACGGGGGSSSPQNVVVENSTDQLTTTEPDNPTSVITNNALTLVPSGSGYLSTSLTGFTQLEPDAHYQVADTADDEYDLVLSASGSGMLTFEFDDEKDVIILDPSSQIKGFSDLKIINGTMNASNADIGSVVNISVASSIKLSVAQVLNLEAIVINAESGSVEVSVETQDELDQLTTSISTGALKLYSPKDNLLNISPSPASSITQDKINESKASINAEKRSVDEAIELGIAQSPEPAEENSGGGGGGGGSSTSTPAVWVAMPPVSSTNTEVGNSSDVSVSGKAVVAIANAEDGLTAAERSAPISINVTPEEGSDVVGVIVGGETASNVVGDLYQIDGANLAGGYHTVSVTTKDASGVEAVTDTQMWVVGTSNIGSEMFDFRVSSVGDVITIDAYVKNLHEDLGQGVKTIDLILDMDASQLDYVEGSFKFAKGMIASTPSENTPRGEIVATGIYLGGWTGYDDALFSFSAKSSGLSETPVLRVSDLMIWDTDLGNFAVNLTI